MPTITGAIEAGRTITHQRLGQMPAGDSYAVTHKPQARLGPEKISIARLPITGSDIFDREQDIAFLNDAWENQIVNVVTIVARAGVGKSTLVNHWLDGWLLNIIVLRNSFLVGPSGRAALGHFVRRCISSCCSSLVWRSGSTDWNGVGEGRKIGETYRASSNLTGSGRPGAAPIPAWFTTGTVT